MELGLRFRVRGGGVRGEGLEVRANAPPSGLHWTSWMGPSLLRVTLLTW